MHGQGCVAAPGKTLHAAFAPQMLAHRIGRGFRRGILVTRAITPPRAISRGNSTCRRNPLEIPPPDPASFAAPHHACSFASSARQASKDSRATLVSMLSKVSGFAA